MRYAVLIVALLAAACNKESTTDAKRSPITESPAITYDPVFLRRVVQDLAGGHVFVLPRVRGMAEYRDVAKVATELDKGVIAATPFTFFEVRFRFGAREIDGQLKGVPPERVERNVKRHISEGALDGDGIVLGYMLAKMLGATVGAEVSVQLLGDNGEPAPTPPRTLKVTGLLKTDFAEYDHYLAMTTLASSQLLQAAGDSVMGVELALANELDARRIARALETKLGVGKYQATDWCDLNRALFGCRWRDEPPPPQ